jgi:AbrB family looped-hinge helix DNA binding protein
MATAKVDKSGRVLIPKAIRDHLGFAPGTELTVMQEGDTIVLRSLDPSDFLAMEGNVLVFTGEAQGDLRDVIRKQREERDRVVAGMERPRRSAKRRR